LFESQREQDEFFSRFDAELKPQLEENARARAASEMYARNHYIGLVFCLTCFSD